jgi:transcription-repair coupling factor (superfamily II helicase)
MIVLPDRESAEYCASDLYNMIEGDRIFFMPDSGRSLEKSNYKSSLGVQRTSALGRISGYGDGSGLLVIVTYPAALNEAVPDEKKVRSSIFSLSTGMEISHDDITGKLFGEGFERVDFVSAPGQFAVRGGIIDIFSYSFNNPYRISFFGEYKRVRLQYPAFHRSSRVDRHIS